MNPKISEIVIDGKTYVPKDSLIVSPNYSGNIEIVILQRGWVYIGRLERKENGQCILRNGYNIRTWGTTKGLPELVHGATSKTVLDKCEGEVKFHELTIIHSISVNEEKWKNLVGV